MRYQVIHATEYRYISFVQTARHQFHLTPRRTSWQSVQSGKISVAPLPGTQTSGVDAFGNEVTRIELTTPHNHLKVVSECELTVAPRPWSDRLDAPVTWEATFNALDYQAQSLDQNLLAALMMRFESPGVRVKRELEAYAVRSFSAGRPLIDACRDLMQRIYQEFTYDPSATEVGTSVMEIFHNRRGVCQDFAHFMIGCLRAMGLAARYVSGYLRTEPPEGQPRLIGADASHAWVAVFVPAVGWVEFDPTNNCFADARYLVLGWGRDFGDVSPIKGVIQGGGDHELVVGVTVIPLEA